MNKRKVFCVFIVILITISIIGLTIARRADMPETILSDIQFGMSPITIMLKHGIPESVSRESGDTGCTIYTYSDIIMGNKADVQMIFTGGVFKKMKRIELKYNFQSNEDTEAYYNQILTHITTIYDPTLGFIIEPSIMDDDSHYSIMVRSNNGATGLYCKIIVSETRLIVINTYLS